MGSVFLTAPNLITLFRIFLVPILVALLISPLRVTIFLTVGVFLVAAATDWVDGRIARRYNQVTALGALLDPIADKLLIMAALVSLASLQKVPAWVVVALIGRDFAVSGIRQISAQRGTVIPAGVLGKYKTALEMIAVVLVMVSIDYPAVDPELFWQIKPSLIVLVAALVLALISAGHYLSRLLAKTRRKEPAS